MESWLLKILETHNAITRWKLYGGFKVLGRAFTRPNEDSEWVGGKSTLSVCLLVLFIPSEWLYLFLLTWRQLNGVPSSARITAFQELIELGNDSENNVKAHPPWRNWLRLAQRSSHDFHRCFQVLFVEKHKAWGRKKSYDKKSPELEERMKGMLHWNKWRKTRRRRRKSRLISLIRGRGEREEDLKRKPEKV